MPIKFRCQHCRQFLGISRGKAGALVDCPTCGRTVRVPHLDGRVEPLPEPGMDPRDSRLFQALDELARIGDGSEASQTEQRESRHNAAILTREEIPIALPPLPEPDPVEAPAALTPAPAAGGIKVKPLSARPHTASPADDSRHAVLNRARQSSAFSSDLFALAASEMEAAAQPLPVSEAPGPRTRTFAFGGRIPKSAIFVVAIVAVVAAAVVGFFVGRANAPGDSGADDVAAPAPSASSQNGTAPVSSAASSGLAGRISCAKDRQTWQADDGARIVALPAGAPPDKLLSAEILLDNARRSDAARELAAVKGGFAVSVADGTFELALPSAGVYRVLVVSGRQQRDEQAPLDPGVDAIAREWLDRPGLITERACRAREVRYSGEGRVPFDCVFESN